MCQTCLQIKLYKFFFESTLKLDYVTGAELGIRSAGSSDFQQSEQGKASSLPHQEHLDMFVAKQTTSIWLSPSATLSPLPLYPIFFINRICPNIIFQPQSSLKTGIQGVQWIMLILAKLHVVTVRPLTAGLPKVPTGSGP